MQLLAGLGPLGVPELLIIAVIILLVFGVGRLPEVGGAVGKSIREFRKATKDGEADPSDAATPGTVTSAGVASSWSGDPGASASSSAPPDTVFCGECGTRNARSAKFCAQCGHTIGAPVG